MYHFHSNEHSLRALRIIIKKINIKHKSLTEQSRIILLILFLNVIAKNKVKCFLIKKATQQLTLRVISRSDKKDIVGNKAGIWLWGEKKFPLILHILIFIMLNYLTTIFEIAHLPNL